MAGRTLITEAYTAYRKKRYAEASAMLENMISGGARGAYERFLLAAALLRSDKIDRASRLLEEIRRDTPDYLPAERMSAFLNFKSSPDKESAAAGYAAAIARHPGDRMLKRAIRIIASAKNFPALQRAALLADYVDVPSPEKQAKPSGRYKRITAGSRFSGFNINYRFIAAGAAAAVLTAGAVFFLMFTDIRIPGHSRSVDPGPVDLAVISGSEHDIDRKGAVKGAPEFYASPSELYAEYNRSRELIKKGRANDALLILNKILNSNASFSVKERADFLVKFIGSLEDRTYDTMDARLLNARPYLYRGAAVKCGGKVANLKRRDTGISFTLMLDYRDKDVFSGTVHVYYEGDGSAVDNGSLVQIDAVFVHEINGGDKYLSAKKINLQK